MTSPSPSPRPALEPRVPDLDQPLEILRALLALQLERLEAARALERERSFVFPETSVIAKDVMRLVKAIHPHLEIPGLSGAQVRRVETLTDPGLASEAEAGDGWGAESAGEGQNLALSVTSDDEDPWGE